MSAFAPTLVPTEFAMSLAPLATAVRVDTEHAERLGHSHEQDDAAHEHEQPNRV